jgi:hypothetical protein
MPWQLEAMKDVGACEKRRLGGNQPLLPDDVRMGKPGRVALCHLLTEYIGLERRTRGTETSKYPEEKKSTEIL